MKYRIINFIFKYFLNPYKIEVSGYCPRQAEGELPSGEYYYFRARGSSWSIHIAKSSEEIINNDIFNYREVNYKPWPDCGFLQEYECIKLANKGINKYYDEQNTKQV